MLAYDIFTRFNWMNLTLALQLQLSRKLGLKQNQLWHLSTSSHKTVSSFSVPSIETTFPSVGKISWTSACLLLDVANVLEALQLCLLARSADRDRVCRNIVRVSSSRRKERKTTRLCGSHQLNSIVFLGIDVWFELELPSATVSLARISNCFLGALIG